MSIISRPSLNKETLTCVKRFISGHIKMDAFLKQININSLQVLLYCVLQARKKLFQRYITTETSG